MQGLQGLLFDRLHLYRDNVAAACSFEQRPGIGFMNESLTDSFFQAEIFGAPLHASIQSANGNVAVWVLAIVMIVLMTGSQFVTQLQIM